ncbi:MAG TPA: hypothetical protein VIH67_00055 [Candidatus Acidoferrum sp.]
MKKKIALWIEDDQLAKLKEMQEEFGVSFSEAIRRGLDMYLDQEGKLQAARKIVREHIKQHPELDIKPLEKAKTKKEK